MMMEVFGKVSMPFYKFGAIYFSEKIDRLFWPDYISREFLKEYRLKSSTEVSRARKALIANDILDDFGKQYSFEDPIYEYWLKNVFFKD